MYTHLYQAFLVSKHNPEHKEPGEYKTGHTVGRVQAKDYLSLEKLAKSI